MLFAHPQGSVSAPVRDWRLTVYKLDLSPSAINCVCPSLGPERLSYRGTAGCCWGDKSNVIISPLRNPFQLYPYVYIHICTLLGKLFPVQRIIGRTDRSIRPLSVSDVLHSFGCRYKCFVVKRFTQNCK